jgi:hypothetical protein
MKEFKIIRGESSQSFDIGYGDPDTNVATVLTNDDTCKLHVVQNINNQNLEPIINLSNFIKSGDSLSFLTKLTPIDTNKLKPGNYFMVWKIENTVKDFALEYQAKLEVLPSGIHT